MAPTPTRPAKAAAPAERQERIARRYANVPEMVAVVAYAEVRSIMLTWAGILRCEPEGLCRRAVQAALEGRGRRHSSAAAFGTHVRDIIRGMTAAALMRAGRRLGAPPWDTLGEGQRGDVAGLEVVFHAAGEAGIQARARDQRVLAIAASLAAYVRELVTRQLQTPTCWRAAPTAARRPGPAARSRVRAGWR